MNDLSKGSRDILYRMSFMKRYNNAVHIHDENVAEHSFYVAIYAMEICNVLGFGLDNAIRAASIERALIHDIHETELSDIPHNIKYGIAGLNEMCINFEKSYNEEYFKELVEFEKVCLGKQLTDIVKNIVDLADVISVLQYAQLEMGFGNRDKFGPIVDSAKSRINRTLSDLQSSLDKVFKDHQRNSLYINKLKVMLGG